MADTDPLVYMLDRTDRLVRAAGALNDTNLGGIVPDSPAAEACGDGSLLGDAVLDAYMIGASQIGAAMDFVAGMVHLCRPEVHRYSVFATGRAALEASSRAWWILERGLSRRERAQRGLKERCRGLSERARLERAMGVSSMSTKRRMAHVRKRARQLGLVGGIGRPPDVSDLFTKAFLAAGLSDGEGRFAMTRLSGYVHVAPWAVLAQLNTVGAEPGGMRDPRTTLSTPAINYKELAYTIESVAQLFSLAFSCQVGEFGWDMSQWVEAEAGTMREIRRAAAHIVQ